MAQAAWLNAARLRGYLVVAAVVQVAALLFLLATAQGMLDRNGNLIGTDFLAFKTAGNLIAAGLSPYDTGTLIAAQRTIFASQTGYTAFFYPPPFLLFCRPLAELGYLPALAVWLAMRPVAAEAIQVRQAPLVRSLRVQLNETTSFFIRSGWEVEGILTETSEQALRYSVTTGRRLPMHVMAAGKALLAALPDDELDRYFAESVRERFTPATITSEKALRKQIAETRRTGYAVTDEEYSLGIRSIGHAVTINGEVVGSLSCAIPKVRWTPELEDRVIELLDRTSGLLETR